MTKHKHSQKRDLTATQSELEGLQERVLAAQEEKRQLAEHLAVVTAPAVPASAVAETALSGGEAGPSMLKMPPLPEQAELAQAYTDVQDQLRQLLTLQMEMTQAVMNMWCSWILPQFRQDKTLH